MPQALYAYISQLESNSADARQQFLLTMAAIGSVFSKNGSGIARRILASFDGPSTDVGDIWDDLTDTEKLVLFGVRDGSQTNPN